METQQRTHENKPIRAGLRAIFFDLSTRFIVSLVAGIILLFTGIGGESELVSAWANALLVLLGALVSVYVGYVAYTRFSQSTKTLITMVVFAVLIPLVMLLVSVEKFDATRLEIVVAGIITFLGYFIGWHCAKRTSTIIYIPSNETVSVLSDLGAIVSIFIYLFLLGLL